MKLIHLNSICPGSVCGDSWHHRVFQKEISPDYSMKQDHNDKISIIHLLMNLDTENTATHQCNEWEEVIMLIRDHGTDRVSSYKVLSQGVCKFSHILVGDRITIPRNIRHLTKTHTHCKMQKNEEPNWLQHDPFERKMLQNFESCYHGGIWV